MNILHPISNTFKNNLQHLLSVIVASRELHAKWLNTLSYLENCGARKIAACEHPTQVKEEMLKHAAEEFRHAHHLKKQIAKVFAPTPQDYACSSILGGITTFHYLNNLDIQTCRYLSTIMGMTKPDVRSTAYLLVTYAIELRADSLYPIYHDILKRAKSPVSIKSIVLEEKEHLAEMQHSIDQIPNGQSLAQQVCEFEACLCQHWLRTVQLEVLCQKWT